MNESGVILAEHRSSTQNFTLLRFPGGNTQQLKGAISSSVYFGATAIADDGTVVGTRYAFAPTSSPFPDERMAIRWMGTTPFGLIDEMSSAYAATDVDTIAGNLGDGYATSGFLLKKGMITRLLPSAGNSFLNVRHMNRSGVIVGDSSHFAGADQPREAVRWDGAKVTLLSNPISSSEAFASRINSSGLIIGNVSSARNHATVWTSPGQGSLLPTDGNAYDSYAYDINDQGDITGIITYRDRWVSALWVQDSPGHWNLTDLNKFIPQNSDFRIHTCHRITNLRWMACVAAKKSEPENAPLYNVLLRPVTTP